MIWSCERGSPYSLYLSLLHSLTLSLVSFCIGQIIRYNQMSSIHILVPTPSFPPTEEHNDDDDQAAPLALTWCCVYIVSILEKKTFSPLVPQVVSHPSRIHHRSRSNVCNVSLLFMLLFLCVLLVNENIRCSKTSERNGYLGKNEGEIKKKKKRKEERKRKRSRPVPSEWYGQ